MKLYISDLDGTLLNSHKEVSGCSKDILNSLIANGVNFSIATARTAASAVKILSGLNINIPVVLMNGAAIYDIGKTKYIKTEEIPSRAVQDILETLREYGTTGFMYSITNDELVTYYEKLNTQALRDFHDERVANYYKTFEQVDSFFDKLKSDKIVYFALIDEYERLSGAFQSLKEHPDIDVVRYRDIYAENLWFLEIYSKNASKYNAVKYLREHCNFDRIIGFGDNFNDIPLFKACDEGYAVSNAVEELKELATGIIEDNVSDGVAKFIVSQEMNFER